MSRQLRTAPDLHDAVLVGLARREQGLLLPPGNPKRLHEPGRRAQRSARGWRCGSKAPARRCCSTSCCRRAGAALSRICAGLETPSLTGPDLAELRSAPAKPIAASQRARRRRSAGLDFVPLLWENFDLAMRQRSYFRPPMQALIRLPRRKAAAPARRGTDRLRSSPAGQIPLRGLTGALTPTPKWLQKKPIQPAQQGAGATPTANAPRRGRTGGIQPEQDCRSLAACARPRRCSPGTASAQVSDDVVKIGVLTDMNGRPPRRPARAR